MLLSGEQPVQASFQVTELGSRDGLDWVELRPKSKESSFVRAKLGFAGKSLQVMELMDSFGQMTRVEFSHMRRNPPLDDSLFNFVPPPNVDVIGDEG